MKREFLEKCLAQRLSIEQIARLVDRHPSTVGYHLAKHGLSPVGSKRHAPNGKVDPDRLRELVDDGLTIREIARELGVGYSTVRHWLKRESLKTANMIRAELSREALENGERRLPLRCRHHGVTWFVARKGAFRCGKCVGDAVSARRRTIKQRLVEAAGGACVLCGYDRCRAALHFHHVDPNAKSFQISRNGVTRSFTELGQEAAKCVLLCANCHAEVEGGVATLPAEVPPLKLPPASASPGDARSD